MRPQGLPGVRARCLSERALSVASTEERLKEARTATCEARAEAERRQHALLVEAGRVRLEQEARLRQGIENKLLQQAIEEQHDQLMHKEKMLHSIGVTLTRTLQER